MRVAIIHDWLLGMRGGERCLEVLCSLFPNADIYTLFYEPSAISEPIRRHHIRESCLGKIVGAKKIYRYLLPIFSLGIRDLSKQLKTAHQQLPYDAVISVSHCVAKNIEVPVAIPHLCYCLTPTRYLWDQYDRYFSGKFFEPLIRQVVKRLRKSDIEAAKAVDRFVAISNYIANRIMKVYQREADVIFPPVRSDWISPRNEEDRGEGFLCVNALVPYKNVSVIVEAFNKLQMPLKIVGTGPEYSRLKKLANPNIEFLGRVSDVELAKLYRGSKALIFAAEEDFGMTPVEMQFAGRPVICFAAGGALETVVGTGKNRTGVFFEKLEVEAICEAVRNFLDQEQGFTVNNCLKNAANFSMDNFSARFSALYAPNETNLEFRRSLSC